MKDIYLSYNIILSLHLFLDILKPRRGSADARLVALARLAALAVRLYVALHDQHPLLIVVGRVLQRLGDVRMLLRVLATAAPWRNRKQAAQ